MGVYVLSKTLLTLGFHPDKTKKIRDVDGTVHVISIGRIAGHEPVHAIRDRILGDLGRAVLHGAGIGVGILIASLLGIRVSHWRCARSRRLGSVRKPYSTPGPGRRAMLLAGRAVRRLPTVTISVQIVAKADKGKANDGGAEFWRDAASGGNPHAATPAVAASAERRGLVHQSQEQSERKGAPLVAARLPARGRRVNNERVVSHPELPFGEHVGGDGIASTPPAAPVTVTTPAPTKSSADIHPNPAGETSDERPSSKQLRSPPGPSETRRTVSSGADRPGERNKPHLAASRDAVEPDSRVLERATPGGTRQPTEPTPPVGKPAGKKKTRGRRSQDFY